MVGAGDGSLDPARPLHHKTDVYPWGLYAPKVVLTNHIQQIVSGTNVGLLSNKTSHISQKGTLLLGSVLGWALVSQNVSFKSHKRLSSHKHLLSHKVALNNWSYTARRRMCNHNLH